MEAALLAVAAVFLLLHGVHLRADFPNHSPWMDWAKYTDEGWYGDAAIRYFQRGSWYVPGDFNPAAALPVWPLAESALFHFTGANVIAARSLSVTVFVLIVLAAYLLLRRSARMTAANDFATSSLAPAIAALLLAVSPFCYVFSRLAILEPMLILLTTLALLTASYVLPEGSERTLRYWAPIIGMGLILPLMVLTKTTAVFLMPAVFWMLYARRDYSLRSFVRAVWPVLLLAGVVWATYYGLVVRPRFLEDYHYLFAANAYTGITRENALSVLQDTFTDGTWIGRLFYPLALVAILVVFSLERRLLRNPVVPALLLWIAGYESFLAYHDNLQPRYYLVVAVPFILLSSIALEGLWNRRNVIAPIRHLVGVSAALALAVIAANDARHTLHYVRYPEYTFSEAAQRIRQIVTSDHKQNQLVLSISGSDLSLMTGLPSICDDFGTMELSDRVRAYHPGWYITWNEVDDDKMDALTPIYHLHRVAAFPAMDDPERNLLILYRLEPPIPNAQKRHRRKPAPQLLTTSFGQQPTVSQLTH
ncbi:MAG: phospholipid carrier-dependent glycosyltransferase [Edaphobacter sp.]|uniref:phospholipid carrier-dependent glycosyltransferase n=1 Tax=Edaphobacter sp. TaxID=1934404 RepID=UPI00238E38F8|nr:phospholipid carrier-dependent glycosyltransferase [Edaphobacter sp.]MDE1175971.1 phospholipid carrier-dependent glycosyltransferase [Edaphobacter sp.]